MVSSNATRVSSTRAEDVIAWCGGAVLLRADYLDDVGLFDERLFLYYEDLELSLRGAKRGWRYRYEPRSDRASSRRRDRSARFASTERFKERNRLLVLAATFLPGCPRLPRSGTCCRRRHIARRDITAPLLHGHAPNGEVVVNRLRAFGGYLRLLPAMWRTRFRSGKT